MQQTYRPDGLNTPVDARDERWAHTFLGVLLTTSRPVGLILIGAGLAGSWALIFLAGGADRMVPHWYYIPILFAAARFGSLGALTTALAAGLLAGPLTYVDVAAGTQQDLSRWVTRTGFFVGIGLLMAWLIRPWMSPIAADLRALRELRDLRRGLAADEFLLRYQPIISLQDQSVIGFEALVRWQHPSHGERLPGSFLPLAESSNLICELGERLLDKACAQAGEWNKAQAAAGKPPCFIAVNMAARELEQPDLPERIADALKRHGIAPEHLQLEVTESQMTREGSAERLYRIRALGVQVAVDDFGTGYSSLSYLSQFPVDILKVDRSLVVEASQSPSAQALARGIVRLAHSLGASAVAEGIETETQQEVARMAGCHAGQGFLFARPLDAEQAGRMLEAACPAEKGRRKGRPPAFGADGTGSN